MPRPKSLAAGISAPAIPTNDNPMSGPADAVSTALACLEPGSSALAIPDVASVLPMERQETSPYITFASSKSTRWPEWSAAHPGLSDGDPLFCGGSATLRLQPFRYFFPGFYFRAWTLMSDSGVITAAFSEDQGRGDGKPGEHIEAVVLAFVADTVTPARVTFRTTKTNGIAPAVSALHAACSPDWMKLSNAHAASARFPKPFGRFVVNVSLTKQTARSSGRPYVAARGSVVPSTEEDQRKLLAFFSNAENVSGVWAETLDAWKGRVAEIARVLRK